MHDVAPAGPTVNGHTPHVPPGVPLVPADVSGSAKLSPEEVSGIREGSQPPAQKAGKSLRLFQAVSPCQTSMRLKREGGRQP
jgi:hypothetical protein